MDNQETNAKYCPNCGEAVEQSQKFCKGCGTQLLNEEAVLNQNSTETSIKEKLKSILKKINKKVIIIASAVIAIVCIIVVICSVKANIFNEYEKTALSKTEYLIDSMKDPDSFKLQSDIIYVKFKSDDEKYNGKEAYYIEYSANNSYGGREASYACFFDYNSYIDLYDTSYDAPDKSDYGLDEEPTENKYGFYNNVDNHIRELKEEQYEKALDSYLKNTGRVNFLKNCLSDWNYEGAESESFVETKVISAKKIAKKAKCEYSK